MLGIYKINRKRIRTGTHSQRQGRACGDPVGELNSNLIPEVMKRPAATWARRKRCRGESILGSKQNSDDGAATRFQEQGGRQTPATRRARKRIADRQRIGRTPQLDVDRLSRSSQLHRLPSGSFGCNGAERSIRLHDEPGRRLVLRFVFDHRGSGGASAWRQHRQECDRGQYRSDGRQLRI